MARIKLEVTLGFDPSVPEDLTQVAAELQAGLDPVRWEALLGLARGLLTHSGELDPQSIVTAKALPVLPPP